MGELSTVLLATSVGFQTINTIQSSVNQAASQKLEAKFKSQQLQTNSKLAEIQAKDSIQRGKREADEHKTKVKQLIGRQRAALAAQGIEIDSGSALDIQLETAEFGALDALTIKNNAFREATGFRIQALDLSGQARFAELSGRARSRNTLITGGLTAITGLAAGGSKLDELGAFDRFKKDK